MRRLLPDVVLGIEHKVIAWRTDDLVRRIVLEPFDVTLGILTVHPGQTGDGWRGVVLLVLVLVQGRTNGLQCAAMLATTSAAIAG